jgi:hypothetical protein
MEEIKSTLKREIQYELEKLDEFEVGSPEHKAATDNVAKLVDRLIEIEKAENDAKHRDKQVKSGNALKWVELGVMVVGIAVPTVVKIWGTNKTLRFEETGTVTTMSGKAHINSLFSKK